MLRIAAGAAYGDSDEETGYNLVRITPRSGEVEIWMREYTGKGSGAWKPMVIPGRTDELGRIHYRDLNWLTPAGGPGRDAGGGTTSGAGGGAATVVTTDTGAAGADAGNAEPDPPAREPYDAATVSEGDSASGFESRGVFGRDKLISPRIKLVLEARVKPSESLLQRGGRRFGHRHVVGLPRDALARLLLQPDLRGPKSAGAWTMMNCPGCTSDSEVAAGTITLTLLPPGCWWQWHGTMG